MRFLFASKPVPELDNQLKRTIKISLYILAVLLLILALFPGQRFILGLALGIPIGIYNSITLARRIKSLGELYSDNASGFMKTGPLLRTGLVMAVLFLVSQRMPAVDLLGLGLGIIIPVGVTVTLSIIESIWLSRNSQVYPKSSAGRNIE